MVRLPALLLTVLVFLASTQCFGSCLSDSCKPSHSAPCHPPKKTVEHCSSQTFVADERTQAPQGPLEIAIPFSTVTALSVLMFQPPEIVTAQSASPPIPITVLKI
jgi:hypothetical protein